MTESSKNRASARRFARMLAVQALYRREANPTEPVSDDKAFFRTELAAAGRPLPKDESLYTQTPAINVDDAQDKAPRGPFSEREQEQLAAFAEELLDAAIAHRTEIDEKIQSVAKNWSLQRMAATDRNILRLAVAELDYFPTPRAVVINEAVDLAKNFGEAESGAFVNGILGKIVRYADFA